MPKIVRTKEFLDEITRLREREGMPFAWIAQELGVCRETVADAYYNGFTHLQRQKTKNEVRRKKTA